MEIAFVVSIFAIWILWIAISFNLTRYGFLDHDIIIGLVGITFLVIGLSLPLGMVYDAHNKGLSDLTVSDIEATVIKKDYQPMYTQPVLTGKTTTLVVHPEQYSVDLKLSNGDITRFNDKNYYNSLNVNDVIIIEKLTWTFKNGELYKIEYRYKE